MFIPNLFSFFDLKSTTQVEYIHVSQNLDPLLLIFPSLLNTEKKNPIQTSKNIYLVWAPDLSLEKPACRSGSNS